MLIESVFDNNIFLCLGWRHDRLLRLVTYIDSVTNGTFRTTFIHRILNITACVGSNSTCTCWLRIILLKHDFNKCIFRCCFFKAKKTLLPFGRLGHYLVSGEICLGGLCLKNLKGVSHYLLYQ